MDDFSLPNANFLSEAGEVLTFLLTFCVKTKSKSGFGAEAPLSELAKVELYIYIFSQYIKLNNNIAFTTTTKTLTINKIMGKMYFGLAEKLKRKIETLI